MKRYLYSEEVDSAITILEPEHDFKSDLALAGLYFEKEACSTLQALLDTMYYDDPDFDNWKQLFQIQLDLEADSLTLFDMDSTDYAFVDGLANSGCELSNIQAQVIISFIKGIEYDGCDEETSERLAANSNSNSDISSSNYLTDGIAYLKVIPNPFNSSAVISYNLAQEEKNPQLFLMNYTGQIIKVYALLQKHGILSISANELSKGIYLLTLISSHEKHSVKLIIN